VVDLERLETGGAVIEDVEPTSEQPLWRDDADVDRRGWFCVRTDPFPCPAQGCIFVADYMTAAHLILVWEVSDDPNLLWHAQRAMDVGRNPRIVHYETDFGPSASYYAWEAAGRPVHGIRGKS
jgi:hypothetical protein